MARKDDPPFDGGAQPVKQRPPEVATRGRSVGMAVVTVIGLLVLVVAILWFAVPFGR